MQIKPGKANIILAGGLVGIVGTLLTIVSDMILLGSPKSAYGFLKLGTESMAFLSQWRITVGAFAGIMVLPFQLAGLIPVFYGLKPAGKRLSLIVVLTAAHALMIGVAFHASYAFIGTGWEFYHTTGPDKLSGIVDRFGLYWMIMIIIMSAELLISSASYVFTVLSRKTLFPKWMAVLNPFCIFLFVFPFVYILPSPVGGFIAPGYLNLSTMVFFIFSTVIVYPRLLQHPV